MKLEMVELGLKKLIKFLNGLGREYVVIDVNDDAFPHCQPSEDVLLCAVEMCAYCYYYYVRLHQRNLVALIL